MTEINILDLCEELFSKDKKVNEIIPREVINWFKEIVLENFNKTENQKIRSKMVLKVKHTKKVVEAGWEIYNDSKNIRLDKLLTTLVCFLHDIGRFPQLLENTFSDTKSKIDHGGLASDMIKDKTIAISNKDKEKIAEAIWWHNKKDYLGENLYAFLVRDADKIALFREFETMEKDADEEGLKGKTVSPAIIDNFHFHKSMLNNDIKTKSDWLLYMSTWLWDLNLEASKKIAIKENFVGIINERLEGLIGRSAMQKLCINLT